MATKKRSGGGSNMGLIVTLVFFVLSTVILGITTYLAYAEREQNDKAKADAEKKMRDGQAERDWYRFKSNLLVTYVGEGGLAGKAEPAQISREKGNLDQGVLPFASADKEDSTAFAALVKGWDKAMPWRNDAPGATFKSRLADKDQQITALSKQLADARTQIADAKARADQARDDADAQKKSYDADIAKLKKQRQDDLVSVADSNKRIQTELNASNTDMNAFKTKMAELVKDLEDVQKKNKQYDSDLKEARRRRQEAEEERNEYRDQLSYLRERTGVDQKTLEAAQLDKNAVEALRTWNKDWQVVDIDRTGNNVYINLGTSDRVQPQVTFSVHEMGKDGKLNPVPKGTIEVVATRGPKLSIVRVTSVKNAAGNPIVKGDYIFNPTWDPNAKVKVGLAGVVDLNEDGSDGTAEFIRLLRRQNVEIDSFIDVSDLKAPKLGGAGVTARTKYVVMADSLDQIRHPKATDVGYRSAYEALVKQVREKAAANAVPVISLRRYLDMIGYRAPKISGGRTSR